MFFFTLPQFSGFENLTKLNKFLVFAKQSEFIPIVPQTIGIYS